MEQKMQLKHPAGKKAVSMDKEKFNVIEKFVLKYLQTKGEATQTEIFIEVIEDFKKNNTLF